MGQGLPNYKEPATTGGLFSRAWFKFLSSLWPPQGKASGAFQSGYVQYASAQGNSGPIGVTGSIHFEFGTNLPNPSGTNGPGLLLGSNSPAWIISDQAYTAADAGNMLGITAGETQGSGTANGGLLWLIGGGSFGGIGGEVLVQGGTSANGSGGEAVLQGGNATNGGTPGDAFVSGGQNGGSGANVHLIMTTLGTTSGVVRIRNNSDPIIDFYADGRIYLYKGGGFGTAGQSLKTAGGTPGSPAYWG